MSMNIRAYDTMTNMVMAVTASTKEDYIRLDFWRTAFIRLATYVASSPEITEIAVSDLARDLKDAADSWAKVGNR